MSRTVDLAYPFRGRWLVQNSPADRMLSHGTPLFATAYATDFVPVDERGRSAPLSLVSMLRPEPPEKFPGFGRSLIAPACGVGATVHDGEPLNASVDLALGRQAPDDTAAREEDGPGRCCLVLPAAERRVQLTR